jgi:hypothetical protein
MIGVRFPIVQDLFFFSTASRPVLDSTQSFILWVQRALSPKVKHEGREADHSLVTNAEVKKDGAIPTLPPHALTSPVSLFVFVSVLVCFVVFFIRDDHSFLD